MSLRRFVPHVAARSALTTFGPSSSALTGSSSNPLPGQRLGGWCGELSCVSAMHTTSGCFPSEDGEFPSCSRETANAFVRDISSKTAATRNIFTSSTAESNSVVTAGGKKTGSTASTASSFASRNSRSKGADTPHTTAEPIGQARQPEPNFWFEMATERRSGIDLGLRTDRDILVGNGEEEVKKRSMLSLASTFCDPHNDYAAQHRTMQDFHRSCRFVDGHSHHAKTADQSGNTHAAFGTFASSSSSSSSSNASSASSSSLASNTADTHTSSKRLVHTSSSSSSVRMTTLDHMRKVLPLSRTPQTSVDYFLM